jgi:hypothetical protein
MSGARPAAPNDTRPVETLTALVVGTDDWATEQVAGAFERAGHGVLRCHEPGEPSFPCNALIEGRTCPLDVGFDVAITIRARTRPMPEPGEFGMVCAVRQQVPVVVAGPGATDAFRPWAWRVVESGGDAVSACEQVVAEHRDIVDLREDES